jgi:hypothetical protein
VSESAVDTRASTVPPPAVTDDEAERRAFVRGVEEGQKRERIHLAASADRAGLHQFADAIRKGAEP